ncbi:MAG: hypothetical protein Q8L69_12480 [Gallionellaceae bacterium]|nr:hypothetical protein [Gallionellaceae bacterium]
MAKISTLFEPLSFRNPAKNDQLPDQLSGLSIRPAPELFGGRMKLDTTDNFILSSMQS